jgi:transcriptional regulator with XRE-family HTH domain
MLNEVNPREELQAMRTAAGSNKALAAKLRTSESYLSDVLNGRRDASDGFLKKMGLRRIVVRGK